MVFPHIIHSTRTTVFSHAIQQLQDNSTYRINSSTRILQEILQLQGSSRADHYKASSSDCSPCIQAFYTAESSHKAYTALAGFQLILSGRNSILSSSQHSRSPYRNSQAHSYRILPGEIGFIPKRVKYCISNTILRSVCSNFIYSCA